MNLSDLMADDNSKRVFRAPTDDELKSVGELANKQIALESAYSDAIVEQLLELCPSVPEMEEALRIRKEALLRVREFDLPNAIEALGIKGVELLDGSEVSIKEDVYAGITEDNREGAFKWLEDTGNDGIIKNEVKLPFGKGQDADARQLMDLLAERGYSFTNSRGVHPQTLKAFVRKQLEDGKPMPTDVFSIHVKKVATIKSANKKENYRVKQAR